MHIPSESRCYKTTEEKVISKNKFNKKFIQTHVLFCFFENLIFIANQNIFPIAKCRTITTAITIYQFNMFAI